MIDGKFNVIFRGMIVKKFELEEVKKNLVKLFKSTPESVEKLFCGTEVVIRKGLDYSAAMKYQSALKNAGALVLIKEVVDAGADSTETPTSSAQTKAGEGIDKNTATDTVDTDQESGEEMTVAEPGAQILPPKVYEKRDVNTSDLSLASAGERILPEKPPEHHAQPSIDHLSLVDDK